MAYMQFLDVRIAGLKLPDDQDISLQSLFHIGLYPGKL